MRRLVLTLFFALFVVPATVHAKTRPTKTPAGITGVYYLAGSTEVGSRLVLTREGRFGWTMMYGAIDAFVGGTWHIDEEYVVLTGDLPDPLKFRLRNHDEAEPRYRPKENFWVATIATPDGSPVPNIEAQFETTAGGSIRAIADNRGYAAVTIPTSRAWARIGLRQVGTGHAMQWIAIPEEIAKARIISIVVENPQVLAVPPFRSLRLRRERRNLVIEGEGAMVGGVYKHASQPD